LRNSLDHGFESAAERIRKGKDAQGCIRMRVTVHGSYFQLHYTDDGRGLDLFKLEELGRQRKLLPESCADETIAELIFRSGLSTKDEVSEISGRGVGLDAVRSYMEEQGGGIQFVLHSREDRAHVPFTLILTLPLHLCFPTLDLHFASVQVAG
jgi:chemotaxis protein histidine kinase CheA